MTVTDEQASEYSRFEQRRHQYLAAIGVTSWLSRTALAGARSSPEHVYEFLYGHEVDVFESGVAEDASEVSEQASHQQHAVASVTAASLDLLGSGKPASAQLSSQAPLQQVPAQESKAQSSKIEKSTDHGRPEKEVNRTEAAMPYVEVKSRSGKEKAPRFRLGFWLYKDLLVVDSLPLLSRGGITQGKYQTLCANMVKAMGLDAELLSAPYVLAWPMLAGNSLDQGKAEASLAVNHKINKLLQQAAPRVLLFLGESAAQMAMQREEGIDELRAVVFNYSSQIKAITSLSLTQMLQIPECKKEVWGDLQKVLPVNV